MCSLDLDPGRRNRRRTDFLALGEQNGFRFLRQISVQKGDVQLRDPRLLPRDLFDRLPEHGRVIEGDIAQDRDERPNQVRRVESASEPDLDKREVHLVSRKRIERKGGNRLELRRWIGRIDEAFVHPLDSGRPLGFGKPLAVD